MIALKTNI